MYTLGRDFCSLIHCGVVEAQFSKPRIGSVEKRGEITYRISLGEKAYLRHEV